PPQCPQLFAICFSRRHLERIWFFRRQQFANCLRFSADTLLLAIKIYEQMGAAWRNNHLAKIAPCCFQRKVVGNFERGRQKSRRENRLHRFSGLCGVGECSRQSSASRRSEEHTSELQSHLNLV